MQSALMGLWQGTEHSGACNSLKEKKKTPSGSEDGTGKSIETSLSFSHNEIHP